MAKFTRYQVDIRFKWYSDVFARTIFLSSDKNLLEVAELLRDKVIEEYKGFGWCDPESRAADRLAHNIEAIPTPTMGYDNSYCSVNWGTWDNCAAYHKQFTVSVYKPPAFPVLDEKFTFKVG